MVSQPHIKKENKGAQLDMFKWTPRNTYPTKTVYVDQQGLSPADGILVHTRDGMGPRKITTKIHKFSSH
jgi:hypothetical protein